MRNIIDLTKENLTLCEVYNLNNYIIRGNKLIPVELLEGK